ncbi:MAG: hypothetical protein K6G86_08555 [Bacteroidales bacterium]|nr:hypothetical protein [Bacteroidales bacterium]
MIKYFKTEAEYLAAAKSSFESEVALVGADNLVHFDGANIVVGASAAKTGSIAVLDGNSVLRFISVDTYKSTSFMSNYTVVGVVAVGVDHEQFRGKLYIVHKTNAAKKWSEIYSFRLTGYTLDGTDRTGVLKVRTAADWGAAVDCTISYNASSISELVTQLNAHFQSTAPFTTQNWRAEAVDTDNDDTADAIDLKFIFSDYRQASNSAASGFSITANLLPEIVATSNMLRYSGQRASEGAIACWARALAYYRNDNGTSAYQGGRTSVQTSAKQTYPINLPTWLGTSTKNPGDFCANLRAIYGQGEAGWLKFMKTCLPVLPTNYGSPGDKATYGDGPTNTAIMASKTFTKQDNTVVDACPAAAYCAAVSYNHELLGRGKWFLPDTEQLGVLMKDIEYGTSSSREADPVNKALYAIGGSAISNGSNVWSSSRFNANSAWFSNGSLGYFNYYSMYYAYQAVPLALLPVSESEL